MPKRPHTGEKRKTQQPLKIDRLPVELRDRIQAERVAGRTWDEIEQLSPDFKEWGKVAAEVLALFPDKRLPQVSLHRWYDLRVSQVKAEVLARAQAAREFANAFAVRGFENLPDAVRNALGDQIFALMQSSNAKDQQKFRSELLKLGLLLVEQRKLDIMERAQATNERKQSTSEKALEMRIAQMQEKAQALKKEVDEKKNLSPEELKRKIDEIYGLGQ
ncbi:MAG TPA: hypothetical protein VKZ53_13050 [Candidatus Angelobacter sp.]|nr:hypothetical protein [Candidatus Angelobacter sp.]